MLSGQAHLTAGKAQVKQKHFQRSAQYMPAPQSPLTKGPQVPWKGSWESATASFWGETPGLYPRKPKSCTEQVASWWHFRAPKETQPLSLSSDSLPNLQRLCFLVQLPFATLKAAAKLNLTVGFIICLNRSSLLGVSPFPTSSLCSCILVKAQAPARPSSTAISLDMLLSSQPPSEAFAWFKTWASTEESSEQHRVNWGEQSKS